MNADLCTESVAGRSFPRLIQCLATVLILATAVGAWMARGALIYWGQVPEIAWLAACAVLVVAWGYCNILFCKTSIGPDGLAQGWLVQTNVPLKDITRVKFLRVRGLDWLFAPRLVAKTSLGGSVTFWSADARVLSQIDRFVFGSDQKSESEHLASQIVANQTQAP